MLFAKSLNISIENDRRCGNGQSKFKHLVLKLDDVDSQGTIRGYASFGNIDLGFDVVDKGHLKIN